MTIIHTTYRYPRESHFIHQPPPPPPPFTIKMAREQRSLASDPRGPRDIYTAKVSARERRARIADRARPRLRFDPVRELSHAVWQAAARVIAITRRSLARLTAARQTTHESRSRTKKRLLPRRRQLLYRTVTIFYLDSRSLVCVCD